MDLEKLKSVINVSEVVGKPIEIDKYTTAVPILKVSYGYVGADSDINVSKNEEKNIVNASGFGMTVTPLGILVCGEKTTYIKVDENFAEDRWISLIKSVVSTIKK